MLKSERVYKVHSMDPNGFDFRISRQFAWRVLFLFALLVPPPDRFNSSLFFYSFVDSFVSLAVFVNASTICVIHWRALCTCNRTITVAASRSDRLSAKTGSCLLVAFHLAQLFRLARLPLGRELAR